MPSAYAGRTVLLLGGTSISMDDQRELIAFLFQAGLDVASIETPMGGPLDVGIAPKMLRRLSLGDFIDRLTASGHTRGIDIVAHSYAAFEVVRTLMADPEAYRLLIKSILLVNPPGFKRRMGFFSHLRRIVWRHIVCGYAGMIWLRWFGGHCPGCAGRVQRNAFIIREMRGIKAMTLKGLRNPVRTYREIKDIVSFKIAEPIYFLRKRYGFDFNLFLNVADRMIPVQDTLCCAMNLLPAEHIRVVPGGHNDIVFQERPRRALLDFLQEIRARQA